MANPGTHRSHRMKGFPPEEDIPSLPPSPHNASSEGTINDPTDFEVGSVSPLDHQLEGVVEILEKGSLFPRNPPLDYPLSPTLVELPTSIRYFDAFAAYHLSPTRQP